MENSRHLSYKYRGLRAFFAYFAGRAVIPAGNELGCRLPWRFTRCVRVLSGLGQRAIAQMYRKRACIRYFGFENRVAETSGPGFDVSAHDTL